ncbi:RRM domain-containing protein [Entamoeba marina]
MSDHHSSKSVFSRSAKEKAASFKPILDNEEPVVYSTPSKRRVSEQPVIKRLFITGIDRAITKEQLKKQFSSHGEVLDIVLIDKSFKDVLFGYVTLKTKNDLILHQCMSKLNLLSWKGHKLRLEYARDDPIEKLREEWKMNASN